MASAVRISTRGRLRNFARSDDFRLQRQVVFSPSGRFSHAVQSGWGLGAFEGVTESLNKFG